MHYSMKPEYLKMIQELEEQGYTTSDAQGHADLHFENRIDICHWHQNIDELTE